MTQTAALFLGMDIGVADARMCGFDQDFIVAELTGRGLDHEALLRVAIRLDVVGAGVLVRHFAVVQAPHGAVARGSRRHQVLGKQAIQLTTTRLDPHR